MVASGEAASQYRILEKLGGGGMGVVYKAEDTRLRRLVALKFLPEEFARDQKALERFHREAYAASALNHPNICTIHNIEEHEGRTFIVMELLAGQTLKERLAAQDGPLPLAELLDLSIQISDALDAAHSKRIVHRDIKPANIMISERGQAKVLDFGLAKLAYEELLDAAPEPVQESAGISSATGNSGLDSLTRIGQAVGTPAYMSPEQLVGKNLDGRSDLFSLGLVIYEMATGRRAFEADSAKAILEKILLQTPPAPSRLNPEIPTALDAIVRKLLEKDRDLRYSSAADLREDLKKLRRDADPAQSRSGPGFARRIGRLARAHKLESTTAALLLAAALGGGVWSWLRRPKTTPQAHLTAIPLTSYDGSETMPSFSPDGTQVTFSWDGERQDNGDIYVKLVGAETPLRLTNNPANDFSPAWSPDGRWIAFLRELPTGMVALILISPLGGAERVLTDSGLDRTNVTGPFLSWSPDSQWLAMTGSGGADRLPALFLYSIRTGEKRGLTTPPDASLGDSCPAFSPDGHTIAFFRWAGFSSSDLFLLDLDTNDHPAGDLRRLTSGSWRASSPAWTADGASIIFSATSGGDSSLWRVAASAGSQPERLEAIGTNGAYPAISRDGKRLAYVQSTSDFNIWRARAPAAGGGAKPPVKFIASTRNDNLPQYSPDGKKIAFVSQRSGSTEIWVCNADGSNAVQITFMGGPNIGNPPRWSPDGLRLAFSAGVQGPSEIYIVNSSGGSLQQLTSGQAGSANPSWSSEGQWIYFDTNDTGTQRVPAGGGPPELITTRRGWGPVISPDGKFIYSISPEHPIAGFVLVRNPIGGGDEQQMLTTLAYGQNYELESDGIYFIPRRGNSPTDSIQFMNSATGKIQKVISIDKSVGLGLAVSPDRRWILYSQADQTGSDLMLVDSFQ